MGRIFYIVLLSCFLQVFSFHLNAQAGGMEARFRSVATEVKDEGLASNVLVIKNHSGQAQDIQVQLLAPQGWRLWGQSMRTIQVAARDSAFVPVRISSGNNLNGELSYALNAVVSLRGMTIANAEWSVRLLLTSAWVVTTSGNRLYFAHEADTASVYLRVFNNGNSNERLVMRAEAPSGLAFDREDGFTRQVEVAVQLPPGEETILWLPIKLMPENNREGSSSQGYEEETFRIKLAVQSQGQIRQAGRTWTGAVECFRLDSDVKILPSRFSALPLSVAFNTYNIASEYTYATLSLSGTKAFERNNGLLNYYYQTDFLQNQVDLESFLGNYHYMGYFSQNMTLEAGNLSMNKAGSGISGKGLRGSYTYGKHRIGGVYLQQPNLLDESTGRGIGSFYTYNTQNLRADVYGQLTDSRVRQTKSTIGTADVSWQFMPRHRLRLGGGYSAETHNWVPDSSFVVNGYLARLGYNTSIDKFNFSANGYYGSPGYIAQNGILSAASSISYSMDSNHRLTLSASVFEYDPQRYSRGQLLTDSIFNERTRVLLKYNKRQGADNYGIGPIWYIMRSSYLFSDNYGVDMDYRTRSGLAGIFANAFLGAMDFPEAEDRATIFVANARASLRFKDVNASVRYYYGPHTTMDQLEYLQSAFNPQKIYLNLLHDWWLFNDYINLHTGLNYYYATYQSRHQFNFLPELFYRARNGFVFSAYARHMIFGHGDYDRNVVRGGVATTIYQPATSYGYTEYGAGLKFNLNMPVSMPRNYDARFVVFQDANGNGVLDGAEYGIADVLVRVTADHPMRDMDGNDFNNEVEEYSLISDNEGVVSFRNLPKGNYIIETIPLTAQGAMADIKRFYRDVTGNRTLFLPYSDGARLSGSILLQRDRYGSQQDVLIDNIRVTATNNADNSSYSSLTDRDGRFVMYLPGGEYTLSINESVVDQRFMFVENDVVLTITAATGSYTLNFQLVERQRTIRMAPANSDEE